MRKKKKEENPDQKSDERDLKYIKHVVRVLVPGGNQELGTGTRVTANLSGNISAIPHANCQKPRTATKNRYVWVLRWIAATPCWDLKATMQRFRLYSEFRIAFFA